MLSRAIGIGACAIAVFGATVVFADDATTRVRYDNHRHVQTLLETDAQIEAMLTISPDPWSEGVGIGIVDFRVPPENMAALEQSGITYIVLDENIQRRVDAERSRIENADGGVWYDDFKNLAAIETRMIDLADAYPDLAEVIDVGDTIQGRDIWALRMTGAGAGKPAVLYNATQHAREWIAPMTAMFILEHMLEGYGVDERITRLIDDIEFFFIPVVNPDGYVHTWSSERYWRKNRRNNGDGTFGVDLNRNWDFQWGGGGSSGNPNDQTYRGTAPFSEAETQSMRDFYQAHPNLVASIDFHSYGQLVLFPWAYTLGGPGDDGEHAMFGDAMATAIFELYGRTYIDGPVMDTLYQASGASVDWTWGDQDVYSYTIELRGNDFVIDPDQILPTGLENLAAALVLAEQATVGALYDYPNGLPTILEVGETNSVALRITPITSGPLDTRSGRMRSRVGNSGEYLASGLSHLGGNDYMATFEDVPCAEIVQFYFEIDADSGETYRSPSDAPKDVYEATAFEVTIAFADDFESDLGWTVQNIDITDGGWERGVPAGGGDRGDPANDYDGSGSCYLTANRPGNSDVDGGPTRLISPNLDLTELDDPRVGYARWFTNDDNDADRLDVEISSDGGKSWTLVESVGNTNGWIALEFRVADFVPVTASVVLRFSATDNPNDSVTEAAIDAIRVLETGCSTVIGDVTGDGTVDFEDILRLLSLWGPCEGCPEDLDGSGAVDFADILIVLSNWS